MKTKIFVLIALSTVTMLSADYYQQGRSCPGGNCPYQDPRAGYNVETKDGYYKDGYRDGYRDSNSARPYYPEASGQAYYRSQTDSKDRGYNYPRADEQNQGYSRGQYDQDRNRGQYAQDRNMDQDRRSDSRATRFAQDNASSDNDRRINERIRDRLSGWFGGNYETIILSTSNGFVTITGFVKDSDDLDKINKEAKNVEGVKSVNNNASTQKQ